MAAVSIEPRGCAARYDRTNRFLTVWSSTQVPHILHSCLSEHLGLRHSDIRVIAPDVGGGFGMKALVYPEELLVAAAALEFDRPVKWIQDRYDDLISSAHARDHSYDVDFGFDSEGRLLSVDADVIINIGAYPMLPFGSSLEANGAPRNLPGAYTLQNFRFRARAVATNTCPTGAYRGVSAPLSCFVMEGIMDRIARHLGIDPAEVRRRNLVREFPYQNVLGQTYTDGCFLPSLEQALSTIDYKGLRNRQRNAREHETCLYGIGISVITEQTGMASSRYRARGAFRIPGFEAASARVEPDGTVVAALSLAAQGQGHQTVFSQIISERLGVEIDQIRIVEGDTANTPFGSGAFASRGMVIAGSALDRVAIRIRDKMAAIAAHHLECGAHDLVFASGHAHVNGVTDLRISIQEIAAIAYSRESRAMPTDMSFGLEASEVCDPPSPVVGSAVHIASVKIQKHTGCVEIDRYVVVHDCGLMINPALVDGQIQGGVVQGLGEVLMEHFQYDSTGQPLSVSLLDYQIPRSCNIGAIQIEECHQQTAPAQFKGVGESGTIGAVPAITNAIGDALSSYNCKVNKLPLTASDIRKLIASDVSKQTSIGAATPVMASE
jgi:carbon-monoxide dehydrogenase large subunit